MPKSKSVRKLTEVKEQATDFVLKTKEQVESGEITFDSVLDQAKTCARQATEASKETFNNLKEQWQDQSTTPDIVKTKKRLLLILQKNKTSPSLVLEMVIFIWKAVFVV